MFSSTSSLCRSASWRAWSSTALALATAASARCFSTSNGAGSIRYRTSPRETMLPCSNTRSMMMPETRGRTSAIRVGAIRPGSSFTIGRVSALTVTMLTWTGGGLLPLTAWASAALSLQPASSGSRHRPTAKALRDNGLIIRIFPGGAFPEGGNADLRCRVAIVPATMRSRCAFWHSDAVCIYTYRRVTKGGIDAPGHRRRPRGREWPVEGDLHAKIDHLMARRPKADAEPTRCRLLDAAERLFHDQGVARTSLDDIARAAHVTRGAIYWHFRDKHHLFDAMQARVVLPQEHVFEALVD